MRTSPAVPATRGFSHSLQERSDSPQRERAYVHFQPIHARSFPRQLCGRRVRQALALGSRVAIGTGSRLRLIPGVDTNFTLGLPARRGPTARRFAADASGRPAGSTQGGLAGKPSAQQVGSASPNDSACDLLGSQPPSKWGFGCANQKIAPQRTRGGAIRVSRRNAEAFRNA